MVRLAVDIGVVGILLICLAIRVVVVSIRLVRRSRRVGDGAVL